MSQKHLYIASAVGAAIVLIVLFNQSFLAGPKSDERGESSATSINTQLQSLGGKEKVTPVLKSTAHSTAASNLTQTAYLFLPITSDDLLNPEHRNERSEHMINRHNGLLSVIHNLTSLYKQDDFASTVSTVQIKKFTQALINYVYISYADYLNTPIDEYDLETFNPDLLKQVGQVKDDYRQGYLSSLKKLLHQIDSLEENTNDNRSKQATLRKIAQLTREAKKHSDGFLKTKMKFYFHGKSYSLEQKIAFSKTFIRAKDTSLMNDAKEYFETALGLPEYQQEKTQITQIINELSKVKGI